MTAQGSALTRLRRALDSGNVLVAWATASEVPQVPLEDALSLCLLLAEKDPDRYERAAIRWHGRLCREVPDLTIDEAALVLLALRGLPGRAGAVSAQALAAICGRHSLSGAEGRLDEWLGRRA